MNTLDHIQTPVDQLSDHYLFVTITLPKAHNRKGAYRQYEIMHKMLKSIFENYFESIVGALEFTKKGNIHAHFVA